MTTAHASNPILSQAPVLVELSRGQDGRDQDIIECAHHGIISVVDGEGKAVFEKGDGATPTHMRSTSKPFQVLPLLELGYFIDDHKPQKGLHEADLALFMSSHGAQSFHIERLKEIQQVFGFRPNDLRCGVHEPLHQGALRQMIRDGAVPNELHNCCSGKHTAMLIACEALALDKMSYEKLDHGLQRSIESFIELFSGLDKSAIGHGIDGCSLPSFSLPITNIALMFARLALWQTSLPKDLPPFLSKALEAIWRAATNHAPFMAMSDCFDTALIEAAQGQLFAKIGADGIHALAVKPSSAYPRGLGIIIKIGDGDHKKVVRPLIIRALLMHLNLWPNDQKLDALVPKFENHRGLKYGDALIRIFDK